MQASGIAHSPQLHEDVSMPCEELPVRFFRHIANMTGAYCRPHWHEQIELAYVVDGVFILFIGANRIALQPGDILFVNSNELHEYHIERAPSDIFCMVLNLAALQGRFMNKYDSRYLIPMSKNLLQFQNHIRNDPCMRAFFATLLDEHHSKLDGYEFAVKSAIYGIIARLVRHYTVQILNDQEYKYNNRNLDSINRAISFIEEHYSDNISLTHIADHLGFTKYYFCRFFKDMTGRSPIGYLNEYRIHQAMALLADTNLNIIEIALSSGFSDSNYFSRVFKAITSVSPTDFRRTAALKHG